MITKLKKYKNENMLIKGQKINSWLKKGKTSEGETLHCLSWRPGQRTKHGNHVQLHSRGVEKKNRFKSSFNVNTRTLVALLVRSDFCFLGTTHVDIAQALSCCGPLAGGDELKFGQKTAAISTSLLSRTAKYDQGFYLALSYQTPSRACEIRINWTGLNRAKTPVLVMV